MAEPQPTQVREGTDLDDETPAVPASAEDRKAAAALSSLNTGGDDEESASRKGNIDQEALGKAMSRLDVGSKAKDSGKGKEKQGEAEKKKVTIRVDPADVALLVSPLGLEEGSLVLLTMCRLRNWS